MAWTNTRTWVFGDVLTEDFANDYFTGNLDELRGGGIAIASQAANDVIIAASATQLGRIAAVANSVLVYSAGGVPSLGTTLPNAVQDNITRLGTITTGAIPESLITDGSILARVAGTETISASWTFSATPSLIAPDGSAVGLILRARPTDDQGRLVWSNNAGSTTWGLINGLSTGGGSLAYSAAGATGTHAFSTNGVDRVSITNDGLTLAATKALYLDGGGDTYITESAANNFRIVVGGTTSFEINSFNNLVIPATKALFFDGGGDTYIQEISADLLQFVAGNTVTAKVNATGFGIGKTPSTALDVEKSVAGAYISSFVNSHGSDPYGILVQYSNTDPNDTARDFITCIGGAATVRMQLRSNGGIANYSANNVNLSDADVKDIKGPAPSQRGLFKQLQMVEGKYKDSNRPNDDVMLTAQNVELVFPELVEEFGNTGLKGVREHALMLRAFKVIQELCDENDALEARLTALEARSPRS